MALRMADLKVVSSAEKSAVQTVEEMAVWMVGKLDALTAVW